MLRSLALTALGSLFLFGGSATAQETPCGGVDKTIQLDVRRNGAPFSEGAQRPFIAGDGKSIVFQSNSIEILPRSLRDFGGATQVFQMNLETRKIKLVSKNADGIPADGDCEINENATTHDGRVVIFTCSAPNMSEGAAGNLLGTQIYARFMKKKFGHPKGTLLRVTRAAGSPFDFGIDSPLADSGSTVASIAAFSPVVVFSSWATNLVDPPVSFGQSTLINFLFSQNYVANIEKGQESVELLTRNAAGEPFNSFHGTASVDGYATQAATPTFALNFDDTEPAFEDEGQLAGFILPLSGAEPERLPLGGNPLTFNPSVPAVPAVCDIFPIPGTSGPGQCGHFSPEYSDDGVWLAFDSNANNVATCETPDEEGCECTNGVCTVFEDEGFVDAYVFNTVTGQTLRVSRGPGAKDESSDAPDVSGDGRFLVFRSASSEFDNEVGEGRGIFQARLETLDDPTTIKRVSMPPEGREFDTTPPPSLGGVGFALPPPDDMPNQSADGSLVVFDFKYADDPNDTITHMFLRCVDN